MNKVRVMHILPDFGVGGAEKLVLDLMKYQSKEEFEVSAVSLFAKTNSIYDKEIEGMGLKVIYLDKKPGIDISMFKKIFLLLKKYRPNVINTHRYVIRYVLVPSVILKVPVKVHTVHSIATKELDKIGLLIQKIAYRFFNFIPISITETVRESIKKVYGYSNAPLIVNGINIDKYSKKVNHLKNTGDLQTINLIHVGRFTKAKNHKLLIEIMIILKNKYKNIKLNLVGDGELFDEINYLVKEYNLSSYVNFLGHRNDIPDLLADNNIFLLTSNWEGLPLVLLEAMAAGIPIISTDVGGVKDIIKHQYNGFLVKPDNANDFVEVLDYILKNKEIRDTVVKNASNFIKNYNIKNTQKEYEKLYIRLLNKGDLP
jgi:glycosyltransferase involved in cell wall biosynthesis